jgi:hypothetical protein
MLGKMTSTLCRTLYRANQRAVDSKLKMKSDKPVSARPKKSLPKGRDFFQPDFSITCLFGHHAVCRA